MDGLDELRLRQVEQVVVSLQITRPVLEPLAPESRLVQVVRLDHRAHRAVENKDPLPQQALQFSDSFGCRFHVTKCCRSLRLRLENLAAGKQACKLKINIS